MRVRLDIWKVDIFFLFRKKRLVARSLPMTDINRKLQIKHEMDMRLHLVSNSLVFVFISFLSLNAFLWTSVLFKASFAKSIIYLKLKPTTWLLFFKNKAPTTSSSRMIMSIISTHCSHTHTHTHVYLYIYIYVCVCVCVCVCAYVCLCVWVCVCVYLWSYLLLTSSWCKHYYLFVMTSEPRSSYIFISLPLHFFS